MKFAVLIPFLLTGLFFSSVVPAQGATAPLSLKRAISLATSPSADPWLKASIYREDVLKNESISVATLPDPKVSLMAANFPVDSFDRNQEAMTQLTVGVSQMFPRGDTLALSARQKQELAAEEPLLRTDRIARVTTTVTQLWLEVFRAQQTISLIEQDRSLFGQLVDATGARYSSALSGAQQQDVIRAQLELTRLEDRLITLQQQSEVAQQRLSEWIGGEAHSQVTRQLPVVDVMQISSPDRGRGERQWLYQMINRHPALRAFDQRIESLQTGVELARQKYRPEWGVSAQYGYRDDDPLGRERDDLFSVGVTFDLPLFTGNRQDRQLAAAVFRSEALKTEKLLLTRQLMAELESAIVQYRHLQARRELFENKLLPQMVEQSEAALSAYNNDKGDFAEAVRARITELNAKIEALDIGVQLQQSVATIGYLLSGHADAIASLNQTHGSES